MWHYEVMMLPRDMVYPQNDITWQDSDIGTSWHWWQRMGEPRIKVGTWAYKIDFAPVVCFLAISCSAVMTTNGRFQDKKWEHEYTKQHAAVVCQSISFSAVMTTNWRIQEKYRNRNTQNSMLLLSVSSPFPSVLYQWQVGVPKENRERSTQYAMGFFLFVFLHPSLFRAHCQRYSDNLNLSPCVCKWICLSFQSVFPVWGCLGQLPAWLSTAEPRVPSRREHLHDNLCLRWGTAVCSLQQCSLCLLVVCSPWFWHPWL